MVDPTIRDIELLLGEIEVSLNTKDHTIAVLQNEIDSLRIELNYLRNENVTLRSNQ